MALRKLRKALERRFAMMDISEEHAVTSEAASASKYHTVPSSGTAGSSSSLSVYYSPRIQSMIENRSRFSSETEFDVEYSREHWSELTGSDTDSASTRLADRAHFEKLKEHPEWGGFFQDVKVELGEKINEGGQAEIYDAKVEFEDGRKSPAFGYHVVKLMKGDCPLEEFQRQWPVGMLCNASKDRVKGPLLWIEGGAMVDDRFAFVMVRQWGDLRKLIDTKMRVNNNRGPPFLGNLEFVRKVMLCIARDMDALHTKYEIVHRDLKASNVLLWSFGKDLPDANPGVRANVGDYECSVGVVGTGFWRAPEILEQLKNGVPRSEIVFTFASDVYSYGMVCYELLTGRTPFEGHASRDYDLVLSGNRPDFAEVGGDGLYGHLVQCMEMCWRQEPSHRPTFSRILDMLEALNWNKIDFDWRMIEIDRRIESLKDALFIRDGDIPFMRSGIHMFVRYPESLAKEEKELQLKKGLQVEEDLQLKEGLQVEVDLQLKEGLQVEEDLQLKEGLQVEEDLQLKKGLQVEEDLQLKKGLQVEEDLQLKEGLQVEEDLQLKKELQLKRKLLAKKEEELQFYVNLLRDNGRHLKDDGGT